MSNVDAAIICVSLLTILERNHIVKKILTSLTVLLVLSMSWFAPACAARPSKGSLVLAPPLITQGSTSSANSTKVATRMRLPSQAGKVSRMVATNLVSNSPTWIAKGDKYYSLCAPRNGMVACAPIVAASVMQDIEVGAHAGPNGGPRLTFKVASNTTQTPRSILFAMDYFLARINKQAAHFKRLAKAHTGKPRVAQLLAGSKITSMDGEGEGECVYDDFFSYDCIGGASDDDGGESAADEDDSGWPSDEPSGGCDGNCDFPDGNDNGDPCANGNCPVVIIPGERPSGVEEVALPGCRAVGPFIECGRLPPVVGAEPEQPQRGAMPWFPQSWCDFAGVFCSAGQVPYDQPPPLTDDERRQRTKDQCYAEASAMATTCRSLQEQPLYTASQFKECMHNAIEFSRGCDLIGNHP